MARGSTGGVLGMLADVKDPVRLLRRIAITVVGTVILAVPDKPVPNGAKLG